MDDLKAIILNENKSWKEYSMVPFKKKDILNSRKYKVIYSYRK